MRKKLQLVQLHCFDMEKITVTVRKKMFTENNIRGTFGLLGSRTGYLNTPP